MSSTWSVSLAPAAMSGASAPEAPIRRRGRDWRITLWRTAAPSRLFSMICRWPCWPDFSSRTNIGAHQRSAKETRATEQGRKDHAIRVQVPSTPSVSVDFDRSRHRMRFAQILNAGSARVGWGRLKAVRSVPRGSIAPEIRRSLRGRQASDAVRFDR
jgi:hypothetical protein